ncbi:MAG: nitroreductase/quinone reductase family protein [Dehalococcoidia bacterium]
MPAIDPSMADDDYCYLTTTGRVSARPHTIEIWFGLNGDTLYLLSGGAERSDWVKNLRRTPAVSVRIRDRQFAGRARVIDAGEEDVRARAMLVGKYQPRYGGSLEEWGHTALPVAIDLNGTRDAPR